MDGDVELFEQIREQKRVVARLTELADASAAKARTDKTELKTAEKRLASLLDETIADRPLFRQAGSTSRPEPAPAAARNGEAEADAPPARAAKKTRQRKSKPPPIPPDSPAAKAIHALHTDDRETLAQLEAEGQVVRPKAPTQPEPEREFEVLRGDKLLGTVWAFDLTQANSRACKEWPKVKLRELSVRRAVPAGWSPFVVVQKDDYRFSVLARDVDEALDVAQAARPQDGFFRANPAKHDNDWRYLPEIVNPAASDADEPEPAPDPRDLYQVVYDTATRAEWHRCHQCGGDFDAPRLTAPEAACHYTRPEVAALAVCDKRGWMIAPIRELSVNRGLQNQLVDRGVNSMGELHKHVVRKRLIDDGFYPEEEADILAALAQFKEQCVDVDWQDLTIADLKLPDTLERAFYKMDLKTAGDLDRWLEGIASEVGDSLPVTMRKAAAEHVRSALARVKGEEPADVEQEDDGPAIEGTEAAESYVVALGEEGGAYRRVCGSSATSLKTAIAEVKTRIGWQVYNLKPGDLVIVGADTDGLRIARSGEWLELPEPLKSRPESIRGGQDKVSAECPKGPPRVYEIVFHGEAGNQSLTFLKATGKRAAEDLAAELYPQKQRFRLEARPAKDGRVEREGKRKDATRSAVGSMFRQEDRAAQVELESRRPDPEPSKAWTDEQIDKELDLALIPNSAAHDAWWPLRTNGATDDEILTKIREAFGKGDYVYRAGHDGSPGHTVRSNNRPGFWMGARKSSDEREDPPLLRGPELIARVRKVLGITEPKPAEPRPGKGRRRSARPEAMAS